MHNRVFGMTQLQQFQEAYLTNPQDSLNVNYLQMLLLQVGLSGVAGAQLQSERSG